MSDQQSNDEDWFVFTGQPRSQIPQDVTHIRIHPSVKEIEAHAFSLRMKLKFVEFHDQLETIGAFAFDSCYSLERLVILSSVSEIGYAAFKNCTKLAFVELPSNLSTLNTGTFTNCKSLRQIRLPPAITTIREFTFSGCKNLVSVEVPEGLEHILKGAFSGCWSLKNIFLPSSVKSVANEAFDGCARLSNCLLQRADLIHALKHRFDGLPIHKLCYFQAYHPIETTTEELLVLLTGSEGNIPREQMITMVKQQGHEDVSVECDAFGMTPLHILVNSSRPSISLSRLLLQRYRWPLLMSKDNWGKFALHYSMHNVAPNSDRVFQSLLKHHSQRVKYGLDRWRNSVENAIQALPEGCMDVSERRMYYKQVQSLAKLYNKKEKLSLLELAIWKSEMAQQHNESSPTNNFMADSEFRRNCRIICEADTIISNVLPFLSSRNPF